MRKLDTETYVVIENFKELPNGNFGAIQGAAAMWAESPTTRSVDEVVPVLGTTIRIVPETELRAVLGMITGKW